MQFRVLGTPEIYDEVRQRSVQLTSPKQRVLLGALLVRMGSPVPTEALINELWGHNAPDKAINALQAHVSRLRQQLIEVEPSRANTPRLVARGSGYLLQARPDELDSVQFRLLVARAQRQLESDPHSACVLLRKALKLWRGPALAGGSHGPLSAGVAARLEEERLLALEDLCDASLRMGQHRQVIAQLEELVADHPLRERFRDQLALSLQRSGRPGEARTVRDTVRRRRTAEVAAGSAPVLTAPVRQIHEAGSRWQAQGTVEHAVAEEYGDGESAHREGAASLELLRLRRRVEQLTSEQHTLRSELDRLMALVEERFPARRRDSA
ncbi:DNA-binding SARP family transcriptional activator [Streptomyces sp. SLBN-118]|uniref:AfsR/SARP family transcriptional regulator n=1 Tax=Streptomyces sp. SLBN-118 TaxID=2768454 RepID=UPI00114EE5BB|nr:AfsR/SARP family transcriptional regulator [Streptomyces sp. SLBN-118]TQK44246.1 DNA-binding SARP family transcriptional activator [Streptomyces sp. SLBN-118]